MEFEYPFVCPVIIFFLFFFWVSPSPFALTQPMFTFIDPPHTHTHYHHTWNPLTCPSPSALRLCSLVSSFVSSKNRSSQMSDSRQTPTSSVQCKSHPGGRRVAPLSSPPATEKEPGLVLLLLDFCPCVYFALPVWSESSVLTPDIHVFEALTLLLSFLFALFRRLHPPAPFVPRGCEGNGNYLCNVTIYHMYFLLQQLRNCFNIPQLAPITLKVTVHII